MIRGMTINLLTKQQISTDAFNQPVYAYTIEEVDDVLVAQPSPEEVADELNVSGKRIEFLLGIPKGDTHDWEDQIVEFFGHKFMTFGIPAQGIEENVPTRWHKKVKCERYE